MWATVKKSGAKSWIFTSKIVRLTIRIMGERIIRGDEARVAVPNVVVT